jgi:hypothetical protein
MSNHVKVIDKLSGTTLFETSLEKIEEAYSFAALMEEQGLEITISAPGLAETLINSLGAQQDELDEFKQSLVEEMESHEDDFGCSICPPNNTSKTTH